ncbi:bifunctional enoyl-CoA hydratase/phosphate acetyltransferase [Pseudothermotoga sp. U03pept]|uniref:bifunctional enoyl-CoA hydratase/phosphate acetyltransferase n=1 Tax=Pseudothermotoga sp. U03pept TaxID=3447012 RepID=UPI003F01C3A3
MKSLTELIERARNLKRKTVVVVGAEDEEAVRAAIIAQENGVVEKVILVGNVSVPEPGKNLEIIHADSEQEASEIGVKLVSSGKAEIILKGLVKTSILLKAVLNKEWGLRGTGVLSHVAALEVPALERVVFVTDGGMIIRPTLEDKVTIIRNAVDLLHRLGYSEPKVALICAVETVNQQMPETVEAAVISKMAQRGELKNCVVDGPLGLDNALSQEAAKIKGIKSEVAGKADLLVVPDIHSGNFLGKAAVYLAGGSIAGLVVGAKAPVVVVSRADSAQSKLLSLAMAACAG